MVPMLQCGLFRSNLAFAILRLFFFRKSGGRPTAVAPITTKLRLRQLRLHFVGDVLPPALRSSARYCIVYWRTPLGKETKLVHVAEHVGERNDRFDHLRVAAAVGACSDRAAVDVANDVAEVISGVTTSTFMIGSSCLMPAFWAASRIAPRAQIFKRQRRRVDVVVLAVDQLDFEIDDREADQRSVSAVSRNTLLDRRDIFLGDVPPLMLSVKTNPEPRSPGVTMILISPNWPEPPDCFLWV